MSLNGFTTEDESRNCHDQVCCLVDEKERCTRPAGNASYSKRIQKTVAQRKLRLNIDSNLFSPTKQFFKNQKPVVDKGHLNFSQEKARHIYICDYHKGVIQSVRTKRKRKDSDDDTGSNDQDVDLPEVSSEKVDLFQLQMNTLRRYKRHYKVQARQGLNKAQLADVLMRHFKSIPVAEKEALTYFIYMVKNNKSKFDLKNSDSPVS